MNQHDTTEQKPAHTPGPWRVQYDGNGLVIEPQNRLQCDYVAAIDGRGCKGRLENEANAALIAAAPETKAQRDVLLTACKLALRSFIAPAGQRPSAAEVLGALQSAISKAEPSRAEQPA